MRGWGVKPGWPEETAQGKSVGPEFPGRRSFVAVLIGVGSAAMAAALAVPLVRFVVFPLLRRTTETQWSDAGEAPQFASIAQPAEPVITVKQTDGWRIVVSRRPVYVLPLGEGRHRVLSPVCPHLGCLVPWNEQQKEFLCPCHGSVFGSDGSLIKGPALRGLDYLENTVKDGRLLVRYQYFRLGVSNREVIG